MRWPAPALKGKARRIRAWVDDEPEVRKGYFAFGTDQVIVTKNAELLRSPLLEGAGRPAPARADLATFTDDCCNLLRILKD